MAASDRLSAGKASEDKVVEMSADGSQPRDVDEALEIAQLIEHERPNLWTKRMFRLYGILLLGYMCIILQGYDGSLMGAINDMVCVPSLMRSLPILAASLTICSTASISKIFWNVRLSHFCFYPNLKLNVSGNPLVHQPVSSSPSSTSALSALCHSQAPSTTT